MLPTIWFYHWQWQISWWHVWWCPWELCMRWVVVRIDIACVHIYMYIPSFMRLPIHEDNIMSCHFVVHAKWGSIQITAVQCSVQSSSKQNKINALVYILSHHYYHRNFLHIFNLLVPSSDHQNPSKKQKHTKAQQHPISILVLTMASFESFLEVGILKFLKMLHLTFFVTSLGIIACYVHGSIFNFSDPQMSHLMSWSLDKPLFPLSFFLGFPFHFVCLTSAFSFFSLGANIFNFLLQL